MPKMTAQDAAMLKILEGKYGKSVYASPPRAKSADQARKQNAARLMKSKKMK